MPLLVKGEGLRRGVWSGIMTWRRRFRPFGRSAMCAAPRPGIDMPPTDEKRLVATRAAESLKAKAANRTPCNPENTQNHIDRPQDLRRGPMSQSQQEIGQHESTEHREIEATAKAAVLCPGGTHFDTPADQGRAGRGTFSSLKEARVLTGGSYISASIWAPSGSGFLKE